MTIIRQMTQTQYEAVTMAECLLASHVLQVAAENDLAFVFDTWGNRLLAVLECPGGSLPPVPASPASGWESSGDHRVHTSLQIPRSLAAWLNHCRDAGVRLTEGSAQLRRWYQDGVLRLREDQVEDWVGRVQ
jgi:hypothetical protein